MEQNNNMRQVAWAEVRIRGERARLCICARVTHSPAGIHHPSRGGVTYISTRLLTWVREDAPRPNLAAPIKVKKKHL